MYNKKTMAKIEQKANEIIARFREDLPSMDKERAAHEANRILYLSQLYWMKPTTAQGWQNWSKWLAENAIFWLGYESQLYLWKYTQKNRKAKERAKKYWNEVKKNYEATVIKI